MTGPTQDSRPPLTHLSASGEARMVDTSGKPVTVREATASAQVQIPGDILDALMQGRLPKGEALMTARVAGIQAAKRTGEWIPLCHPLPVDWVGVTFERTTPDVLSVRCTVRTAARTGVEMEALTGATAAALTLYDMAKAADKSITIGPIRLEQKSGGKSGPFVRS